MTENLVESLLASLQTKIFHRNDDPATNKYATTLIGDTYQDEITTNMNRNGEHPDQRSNTGYNLAERIQPQVLPVEFGKLATGGVENNYMVEGVVYQGGQLWRVSGKNYFVSEFPQKN